MHSSNVDSSNFNGFQIKIENTISGGIKHTHKLWWKFNFKKVFIEICFN